ncbi:MAG: hypothetical protein IT535_10120 [Bauldia sp.]|nr:hypothetical protein [Bauldia sp.]
MTVDPSDSVSLLTGIAERIAHRISNRVIRQLHRVRDTLSGDDSGLESAWDEICVQVQLGPSVLWDAYDETVRSLVAGFLSILPEEEKNALRFSAIRFRESIGLNTGQDGGTSVWEEDVVTYITTDFVYADASRWSNSRIRAYIDRSGRTD